MKRTAVIIACTLLGAAGLVMNSLAADPAPKVADSAPRISQAELLARLDRKDPGTVVLDVRTPAEFAAGHVPGARNISHDQLATRLGELAGQRDGEIVVYCRSGRRTLLAEDVLRQAGFSKLRHLDGDYLAWEAERRPIETAAPP